MTDILRHQPPLHIAELQKPGTIFAVDDKRLVWRGEFGDGELNIEDFDTGQLYRPIDPSTGIRQVAQSQWLQKAIADGTFRIIANADGSKPEEGKPPRMERDRDETLKADPYAEARQTLLRALHEEGFDRSHKELDAAVERIWKTKLAERFGEKRPAASTVCEWMTWTDPTLPSLSQLISDSGRVQRAKRLDPLVQEVVDRCRDWYWEDRGRQIKDAVARGGTGIIRLNVERHAQGFPPLKLPSREAYRRTIRASECRENYERKFGKVAAERYWRPSGLGASARYALELVMIDDTVLDVVACIQSRGGRRFPAGRPYLIVAIDLATRCVVGWVLSFKPPSVHTAFECLKRVGRDKTGLSADWLARYPVLSQIAGKPGSVLTDNGSNYTAGAFQDGLAEAGITLSYAAIRAPKAKAVVERFFRTLVTWLLAKLPGHTLDPKKLRQLGYDPATKAVLLVSELEMLIQEFINTYHISLHSGIGEQPAAAWLRSIEAHPRSVLDERKIEMMGYVTLHGRRLTTNGVRWRGLIYRMGDMKSLLDANVSQGAMKNRLPDVAACNVKIKIDPENVGHIWVWNPILNSYVELRSTQDDYAWGLTLDQHEQAKAWAKTATLAFNSEEERILALDALNEFIEQVIPDVSVRERRAIARTAQGPIGTPEPDVPILHADGRHDGLGEIVEHDDAAAEKLDGDVKPSRPAKGVTATGGSHDADSRDADKNDGTAFDFGQAPEFDPQTGLFVPPEDDDEKYEQEYS